MLHHGSSWDARPAASRLSKNRESSAFMRSAAVFDKAGAQKLELSGHTGSQLTNAHWIHLFFSIFLYYPLYPLDPIGMFPIPPYHDSTWRTKNVLLSIVSIIVTPQ